MAVYLLLAAKWFSMPMGFPMPWVITVVILLAAISILSGLFSLGVLKKKPTCGPAAMSSSQPALVAKGLIKRFKTGRTHIEVLKGVDFEALHGEVTMVMGPSGSGEVDPGRRALRPAAAPDAGTVERHEARTSGRLKSSKIDRFRLDRYCGFHLPGLQPVPGADLPASRSRSS